MNASTPSGSAIRYAATTEPITAIPEVTKIPNDHEGNVKQYNNNNKQNSLDQEEQKAALMLVESSFYATFGRTMTATIQDQVCLFLGRGIEPAMICSVIEYTANAPRPSWQYASYVIRAKLLEGIRTDEAWYNSLVEWDYAHAPVKHKPPRTRVWHDWD